MFNRLLLPIQFQSRIQYHQMVSIASANLTCLTLFRVNQGIHPHSSQIYWTTLSSKTIQLRVIELFVDHLDLIDLNNCFY